MRSFLILRTSPLRALRPAVVLGISLVVHGGFAAAAEIEDLRRIYDMTPVSLTNPVVARVKGCGIEIPVSEFRGFVVAEGPIENTARSFTATEKRALLERLVDEHLLLWNAYEQKWDQKEGVAKMVDGTLEMILKETLARQEVFDKGKTPADYDRLSKELVDRCFEKTEVIVSNESYDELKAAAKRLNRAEAKTAGTNAAPEAAPRLEDFPPATLKRVLATCQLGTITIGDFLRVYTATPGERPDLEKSESVVSILKQMLGDGLLIAEARARGLHKNPEVRRGLQINRNVLVRFYAQDRITDRALERLKSPQGQSAVRNWYDTHLKDRYTYRDPEGRERVTSFETERESIENDYFDVLREEVRADEIRVLRKNREVQIELELFEKLPLGCNVSTPSRDPELN